MSLEVEVLESEESNSRKMEISKKVATKGRPTTVKELFGTGLLEGYPVFYNGGKRVVPPCQFEIHACKSQRRASQYICLENGKSLLDVVKECRKSSVKTLEETIHKFVGPMSVKESVVCMNCQGTFLAAASEVEPLCDSCMIIENSEIDTECANSRHLELASNLKSPKRSPLQISSRRGQQKIMKISSPHQPVPKFSGSALASHLKSSSDLRANGTMRDINTRKILKKCSNASLSRPLKSGSSHISMKSKSSSKVTKKYQTMHRMVFEDGGLPDGTEVAYYSNGKKLRDGYKMGWGIMCRCCRTLVSPSQFEAHAGRASHRKPYMHIYTSNGVSLHEFAVSMSKGHKLSADGGKLVLCDGCSGAFHEDEVMIYDVHVDVDFSSHLPKESRLFL
ncbi:uncharacterized protein [Henckelia pumila]|uniref:uncharacterized protein isoform X2 n=1 Tax=Henckelia pumila TaxID=405737 RepID=UPI003C6E847E